MARKDQRHLKGLVALTLKDVKGRLLYDVRLSPGPGKPRDYFALALPEAQARQFYNARKEELKQGKYFPNDYQTKNQETLAGLLDDYLKTTVAKKARQREEEFCRWWQRYFKDQKAMSLTPAYIEQAREQLGKGRMVPFAYGKGERFRSCGPATVNRYTDWLRHVCAWAKKQGRLRENPVLAIERYKETGKQIYFLTEAQENNLREQLTDEQIDAVRLGILTGLRRGEQFALNKQTDLDLSLGAILPSEDKSGRADTLPLSEEALAIVIRQSARHPKSPWLFPGARQRGPLNGNWFYAKQFKPAWKRAGLPMVPGRKLWHSLRHTFGTRLAMAGANSAELKAAGRWTSKAAERYIHLADPILRARLNRLSAFGFPGNASKTASSEAALENDTV